METAYNLLKRVKELNDSGGGFLEWNDLLLEIDEFFRVKDKSEPILFSLDSFNGEHMCQTDLNGTCFICGKKK